MGVSHIKRLTAAFSLFLTLGGLSPLPPPSDLFGPLFRNVQEDRLYPDSKTFADAVPKQSPAVILRAYESAGTPRGAALKAFVEAHFDIPASPSLAAADGSDRLGMEAHIRALWPMLTRVSTSVPAYGSAISLPRPYVVPGGRFREIYYWDSYFTMLGLVRSGRQDLVEGMIDGFGSLVERFGHIPNGTRTYYLSRSQPPFFYLMVGLGRQDDALLKRRNDWLRAEYGFWMDGEKTLRPGAQYRRLARLPDGSFLNRYWDDRATPRDESFREDVELAVATPGRPAPELWRDIRAAAESGWDFSTRWFADGRTLATIRTTRLAPIDLNALMFGMETAIADNCRKLADTACVADFSDRAARRRKAIETHLWNAKAGFYADLDLDGGALSDRLTAATFVPLFVHLAPADRAARVARSAAGLVGEGGLATTPVRSGQQWDSPNGWAPLQWMAAVGLRRYGADEPADAIVRGWLSTVGRTYAESGRMLEKYDVMEQRPGGGGEYALQDGFGWTNGVTLEFMAGGDRTAAAR